MSETFPIDIIFRGTDTGVAATSKHVQANLDAVDASQKRLDTSMIVSKKNIAGAKGALTLLGAELASSAGAGIGAGAAFLRMGTAMGVAGIAMAGATAGLAYLIGYLTKADEEAKKLNETIKKFAQEKIAGADQLQLMKEFGLSLEAAGAIAGDSSELIKGYNSQLELQAKLIFDIGIARQSLKSLENTMFAGERQETSERLKKLEGELEASRAQSYIMKDLIEKRALATQVNQRFLDGQKKITDNQEKNHEKYLKQLALETDAELNLKYIASQREYERNNKISDTIDKHQEMLQNLGLAERNADAEREADLRHFTELSSTLSAQRRADFISEFDAKTQAIINEMNTIKYSEDFVSQKMGERAAAVYSSTMAYQTAQVAAQNMGNGLADAFANAAAGTEKFGAGMKKMVANTLKALGAECSVKALKETAEGIAALSNPFTAAAAGGHFAAAAKFLAAAVAASVAGGALGGGGGASASAQQTTRQPATGFGSTGGSGGGNNITINVLGGDARRGVMDALQYLKDTNQVQAYA